MPSIFIGFAFAFRTVVPQAIGKLVAHVLVEAMAAQ